jgi:tetratricopeptide (TPR) repeat protein
MKKRVIGFITFLFLVTAFSAFHSDASAQSKRVDRRAEREAKIGDDFFRKKDYRSAISKYAEAIRIAPVYPYAHFWKGYAHYYLDEYDQSLSDLNTAFNQGHTPLEVYKVRWFVNLQKGNYDAALRARRKARGSNRITRIFRRV